MALLIAKYHAEGIAPVRSTKDGSAEALDILHGVFIELNGAAFFCEETIEAVSETDDLHAVLPDGGRCHGTDGRVETWGVTHLQ